VTPVPVKATVGAVRPVEPTSVKVTSVRVVSPITTLATAPLEFESVGSLVCVKVLPTSSKTLGGVAVIEDTVEPAVVSVTVTVELNGNSIGAPLASLTNAQ
jgi:hypothetical protein